LVYASTRTASAKLLVVFGFIDFDATFSAAFITILSAVFDLMGHDRVGVHSPPGLQDAIETMRFLVKRGNLAALERLQEIERLWMLMQSLLRNIRPTRVQHPSEPINNESSQGGIQIGPNLDQVVTAGNEHSDIRIELSLLDDNLWDTINNLWLPAQDNQILGHKAMSRIIEGDQGSYWSLYNNPGWELTGEHTVDFAEFERHLEDLYK
jgi:proline utilization trans-activator